MNIAPSGSPSANPPAHAPKGPPPSPPASKTTSSSSSSSDTNAKAADGDYLNWAPGRTKTAAGHYKSTEATASSAVQDMLTLIQSASKS